MDAYERLMKLTLSEVQQREIARVLLQCSGNVSVSSNVEEQYHFVTGHFSHISKLIGEKLQSVLCTGGQQTLQP